MKIVLVIFMTLFSFMAKSAPSEIIAFPVLQSFQSNYADATDVKWEESKDLYKVDFRMDGQYLTAYYSRDGFQVAVARNIHFTELPSALRQDVKTSYEGYWITEIFELTTDKGTSYYVVIENADRKLILQSANKTWTTFSKTEKL